MTATVKAMRWAVVSLLGGMSSAAYAQADVTVPTAPVQGPVQGDTARSDDQLEEIVVTARKRAETLQTTPVAVSAFTGETLERQVVLTLQDMTDKVPGLVFEPVSIYRNASAIFLRGTGYQDVESAYEPAVATVIDGVYLGRNEGGLVSLNDAAQIEVLRGPQGTLFGKNTIGGVIQYTSRQPTGEFEVRGNVVVGNYGRADVNAAVNFPLVADKVFVTVAGLSRNSDGWVRNDYNGQRLQNDKSVAGRIAVRFVPNDRLDYTIIAEANRDRGGSVGNQNVSLPTDLIARVYGRPGDLTFAKPFNVRHDTPSLNDYDGHAFTGNGTLDLGAVTLTSITGYRHSTDLMNIDVDGTDLDFFSNRDRYTKHTQTSQELRLTSNPNEGADFGNTIDWVAGLFYFEQEYYLRQVFSGALGPFGAAGRVQENGQKAKNYAAYAQTNVNLSPALRLTFGGRYTHEKKDFYSYFGYAPGQQPPAFPASATFSNTSFRAGFDYKPAPGVMAYFTFSQGFRAGGFNSRASKPDEVGPYAPENLNSFEGGVKTDFWGGRARLNVTAYYNDYKDMQVTVIQPAEGDVGTKTITSNAGKSTIKGIEVEASVRPVRGLTLSGWISYIDARYNELTANLAGAGVQDYSYLKLQRTPEFESNVSANYVMPVPALNGQFSGEVSWSRRSDYFLEALNRPLSRVDNYSIVNGNISWSPDHERYTLSLWGKNLGNRLYRSGVSYVSGLNTFMAFGEPRTYGLRLAFKYR